MKNKWMKSKVMNNFGLKVISLVVAFIVWLVIINTTNPTITKTFTDIPVKVINENVITSLNQVYEVVDGYGGCGREGETQLCRKIDK